MATRMQRWFYDRVSSLIEKRNSSSSYGILLHKNCRTAKTIGSEMSKSSRSFKSTAVATNTSAALKYDVPEINVAVCLQRLPIITREKSELEKLYAELQEQLEFEHSSLSDYEVYKMKMKNMRERLKNDEDNEALKKEVATLDSEYQELKEIEQQHIKDAVLGNRRTNADETGNKHSPNRQLDIPLFFITQNGEDTTKWELPQGSVEPGETLRQAAEKILRGHVHRDFSIHFMSNAPSGLYRKAERDGIPRNAPKVFFYEANLQGAIHKYPDDMWAHTGIWASKDELEKYLPKNYYQSVLKFLF